MRSTVALLTRRLGRRLLGRCGLITPWCRKWRKRTEKMQLKFCCDGGCSMWVRVLQAQLTSAGVHCDPQVCVAQTGRIERPSVRL